MLNLVDQLHVGGLNATKTQADLIAITDEMRVLDAGCGVGGSSRYLAHNYGCRVEAIDLTPQYVEAAAQLNKLCGMHDRITVRQGSVTELPYADRSFDPVWSQNVTMNVEDKRRMFFETFRVLFLTVALHSAMRRAALPANLTIRCLGREMRLTVF